MAPDGSFNDSLSDDESRPSIASNRLGPLTHHKKPEAGAPFVRFIIPWVRLPLATS
jgi:hypothetical protein